MGSRIPVSQAALYQRELEEKLAMSTAEMDLSVRTTNCLEEKGIVTVGQLLQREPKDLLSIANFGQKTLEEVYEALEKIGFYRASKGVTENGMRVVFRPTRDEFTHARRLRPAKFTDG
ncbi:MAG: DNA-directed RNA polymerase subunit alpha [Planctomycetota bacterium]|nr:MAG: DNA-directed RNA polymerase subunit alpha [Planctomycetota bacterium]